MRRRAVLGAAAGVGVAAACTSTPPVIRNADPPPENEPERETEDPPSVPPRAAGTVLGPAAAVPIGGAIIYTSAAVVVTRPTSTTYVAFSAVCPHAGCLVDKVRAGTISCPCHGSRFHLDGTVATGPAPRPLTTVRVTTRGGDLVLP